MVLQHFLGKWRPESDLIPGSAPGCLWSARTPSGTTLGALKLPLGSHPEWFLAITCTIWLRLEFRGLDSAWFFSPHLLFFHAQGRIFEPRIGFLDPGSTFWPRDLFGVKTWSRNSEFATESFCHGSSGEFPRPNEFYDI